MSGWLLWLLGSCGERNKLLIEVACDSIWISFFQISQRAWGSYKGKKKGVCEWGKDAEKLGGRRISLSSHEYPVTVREAETGLWLLKPGNVHAASWQRLLRQQNPREEWLLARCRLMRPQETSQPFLVTPKHPRSSCACPELRSHVSGKDARFSGNLWKYMIHEQKCPLSVSLVLCMVSEQYDNSGFGRRESQRMTDIEFPASQRDGH